MDNHRTERLTWQGAVIDRSKEGRGLLTPSTHHLTLPRATNSSQTFEY
jgi:hypothetical protein